MRGHILCDWRESVRIDPAYIEAKRRHFLAVRRPYQLLRGSFSSVAGFKKLTSNSAVHKIEELLFLEQRIEAHQVHDAIDRTYPLERVADANRDF